MTKSIFTLALAFLTFLLAACAPAAPVTPTQGLPTSGPAATSARAATLAPTVARVTTALPTFTTATSVPTLAPTATKVSTSTAAPTDVVRAHAALTRHEINKAKNPNAVCNDGTTAVFFFQRGYGSGANKWLIFFKGGGACWDAASCASRDRGLISATPWSQRDVESEGVLSDRPEQNPDFFSWNHVFAPYCSSDWWSGMRSDNNNAMGFYFRGHYIVDAIVDSVMDATLLGTPTLRDATQVIFAGSSAGGVGVRVNLDRLATSLTWADVRGVDDAGVNAYTNPAFTPVEQDQIGKAMMELYKPVLDESCHASSATRPWLCFENAYAVASKQIATPIFIRQDLYDPIALDFQHLDPKNAQVRQYVQTMAMQTSDMLKALPGAFGTATSDHIALELTKFNQDKVDGLTFAQVLGNWYFSRSGRKVVVAPLRR